MTAAGGRLLCESEKSLRCAAEPVQPVIRGPGAIFSALGARPGWPGVRPVANDGLSREVPVIMFSRLISTKVRGDFPGFSRVARGGVSCPS
jgi:hypothetical protein